MKYYYMGCVRYSSGWGVRFFDTDYPIDSEERWGQVVDSIREREGPADLIMVSFQILRTEQTMKPETIPSLTQSNAQAAGCATKLPERWDKKYLVCKKPRACFAPDVVVCCYCGRVGHSSDECRWPR